MTTSLNNIKILIVEDEDDMRASIKDMLAEVGITQTFEASGGQEAIEFLSSSENFIDMVMCDWNMPGMEGIQVLKQLRKLKSDMPFLIVTGRSDMDSVLEAKQAGVTAYIRKPFNPKQLEAKLRIVLHKMAA